MQSPSSLKTQPFRPPSLAAGGFAIAGPKPRGFECARGGRLLEAGAPLVSAFLVTDGLVAVLGRAPGGATAEAGLVGPGGLVGHTAALGAEVATADALALTDVRGLLIDAMAFVRLAGEKPKAHRAVLDYAIARMAEVERLCVCAATHTIEQRLARWLLSAASVVGDRPIEITHQQFSVLFGVRRASVTVSLHVLEGERAVRCRRGAVEIRDMARLEAASCGCHASVAAPFPRQDA